MAQVTRVASGKYPPREEHSGPAERARAGDPDAFAWFLETYLPTATGGCVKAAGRYGCSRRFDEDEFRCMAMEAVWRAVQSYDPSRKEFVTYLGWWCLGVMTAECRKVLRQKVRSGEVPYADYFDPPARPENVPSDGSAELGLLRRFGLSEKLAGAVLCRMGLPPYGRPHTFEEVAGRFGFTNRAVAADMIARAVHRASKAAAKQRGNDRAVS